MKEPVQIEVGQVWQIGSETVTVYAVSANEVTTCDDGAVDADGYVHSGTGCCWRSHRSLREGRLVSPAPPVCKAPAWCGKNWRHPLVVAQRREPGEYFAGPDGTPAEDNRYCSRACAAKPPACVPAGTEEEKATCDGCGRSVVAPLSGGPQYRCGARLRDCCGPTMVATEAHKKHCAKCKPAPTASPAKGLCPTCKNPGGCSCANPATPAKAKDRECRKCDSLPSGGDGLCFFHVGEFYAWSARQSGVSMMAKLPERLPKARMAHVAHDDTEWLEDDA